MLLDSDDAPGFMRRLYDSGPVDRLDRVHGNQPAVNPFFPCGGNGLFCLVTDGTTKNHGTVIAIFHGNGFAQLKLNRPAVDIFFVFITAAIKHRAVIGEDGASRGLGFGEVAARA